MASRRAGCVAEAMAALKLSPAKVRSSHAAPLGFNPVG